MKILAAVTCTLLASTAHADSSVSIYHPKGMLLVSLGDGGGKLGPQVAGNRGAVRCYTAADKITATAGAGEVDVTGCFVGIRRDGKLVPPVGKRFDFSHMIPPLDGTFAVSPAKDAQQVLITGVAGNAIGLWVDCAERRGDLRCQQNSGMAGKFSWEVRFDVLKGGNGRAPAP
jgi:hypothetical protein